MIIEACHIAQFGKWKDADFSFSSGKNSFLWDNGYGKTSFIYFFKLMFYGVSGDRKQDLEENERKALYALSWEHPLEDGSFSVSERSVIAWKEASG